MGRRGALFCVVFCPFAEFAGEVGAEIAAGAHPVKAGETRTVEFPAAFSAYWVRVRADRACTATAQFLYR